VFFAVNCDELLEFMETLAFSDTDI